jgi:hypothetical protein
MAATEYHLGLVFEIRFCQNAITCHSQDAALPLNLSCIRRSRATDLGGGYGLLSSTINWISTTVTHC